MGCLDDMLEARESSSLPSALRSFLRFRPLFTENQNETQIQQISNPMNDMMINGNSCTFTVRNIHIANAIRRSLVSGISRWAPKCVHITKNTSCQTDEYIAHRIGLIPFVHTTGNANMRLHVTGRPAQTVDLLGESFVPFENICIMHMIENQELEIEVEFECGTGAQHTKFSHVSVVGYKLQEDETVQMNFEVITSESPRLHLRDALKSLRLQLDDATVQIRAQ